MIGADFTRVLATAQQGGEVAFSRLWRDGNPPLLRYLRVIAPGTAEDIAAETWVQVIRGLGGFRGDEQAWRAWLFTTARRRVIDEGRRRARRPEAPLAEIGPGQVPVTADAADLAMERLTTQSAMALLSTLPPLQAEVILLRVVAGLDTQDVARIVGRRPGAVRVAVHRGLRKLAETMSKPGVTL